MVRRKLTDRLFDVEASSMNILNCVCMPVKRRKETCLSPSIVGCHCFMLLLAFILVPCEAAQLTFDRMIQSNLI